MGPDREQREKIFAWDSDGAGDRFRTDDLVLGKHTLYQLSYTRSPQAGLDRLSGVWVRVNQTAARLPATRIVCGLNARITFR